MRNLQNENIIAITKPTNLSFSQLMIFSLFLCVQVACFSLLHAKNKIVAQYSGTGNMVVAKWECSFGCVTESAHPSNAATELVQIMTGVRTSHCLHVSSHYADLHFLIFLHSFYLHILWFCHMHSI